MCFQIKLHLGQSVVQRAAANHAELTSIPKHILMTFECWVCVWTNVSPPTRTPNAQLTNEQILELAAAVQARGDADQGAEQRAEVLGQVSRGVRREPTALQLAQCHPAETGTDDQRRRRSETGMVRDRD